MKTYTFIRTVFIVFLLLQIVSILNSTVGLIGAVGMTESNQWVYVISSSVLGFCLAILLLRLAIKHCDKILGFFTIHPTENDEEIRISKPSNIIIYISIGLGLYLFVTNFMQAIFQLVGLIRQGNLQGTGIDSLFSMQKQYYVNDLVFYAMNVVIGLLLVIYSKYIGEKINKKFIEETKVY